MPADKLSKGLSQSQFSGILVVLTVGADELGNFIFFECPCDRSINRNRFYRSLAFVVIL